MGDKTGSFQPTEAKSQKQIDRLAKRHVVSQPDDAAFVWQNKSVAEKVSHKSGAAKRWLQGCVAREIAQGSLFLFIPVFMAAGAIMYFSCAEEPNGLHLAGWTLIIAALHYLSRHFRALWYGVAVILCIFLGALSAKIETWRMATPMLGADVSTRLKGRVVSYETMENGRSRLLVDVVETTNPVLRHGPQRVKLSARSIPADLKPGDGVFGLVRLRAASGPVRPGSYDFGFYSYFQSVGAQGFVLGKLEQVDVAAPTGIAERLSLQVALLRMHMTKRITQAIDGEAGSVAAALITGQRGGISETTNNALRISGLAHILSISGLHMAMVSGMVLVIVRTVLALFPVFSSRYPSKKIAAAIALFVAAFYLMLSGADVAAQRSFVMVAVMLLAVLCDRSAITLRNLAIAALITLVVVPHEILGPSFQMSFSATAALVAAFGWWSKRRVREQTTPKFVGGGIIRLCIFPFISTAVASLVAGVASGLYASYHFSNAAPLGIISNALAFPVMSFAVMPFALLAAIVMPLGLEWYPLQIMGMGVNLVEKIAYGVTAISPDVNPGLIPASALIAFTAGLILLLFLKTSIRFVSIVFFVIGIVLCFYRTTPVLLVSEDARIVGLIEDRTLFINRERASQFTLGVWTRSYNLQVKIGPVEGELAAGAQFTCQDDICSAQTRTGLSVAVVQKQNASLAACPTANIIIVASASRLENCGADVRQVITRQQLALYGSMVLTDDGRLISSLSGDTRPWNEYRKYSRAARGLD